MALSRKTFGYQCPLPDSEGAKCDGKIKAKCKIQSDFDHPSKGFNERWRL